MKILEICYNLWLPPKRVKTESEAYLVKRGAVICDWLPYISHTTPKTEKELYQRTLVALAFLIFIWAVPLK